MNSQNNVISISGNGVTIDISTPVVMSIVNTTPDSFYDGNTKTTIDRVLTYVDQQVEAGATIVDVGGYSTRPGADFVTEDEELNRVVRFIKAIRERFPKLFISVDTFRCSVAKAAVQVGANMVNDVTGGEEKELLDWVAKENIPYVLMHLRGGFKTMHQPTQYQNVTEDVVRELQAKLQVLHFHGAKQVIVDPGFGFSKTLDQNYEILNNLENFSRLYAPLLVGVSRKSMLYKCLKISPEEALNSTSVVNTIALLKGAKILRVHDTKEALEAIQLVQKTVYTK